MSRAATHIASGKVREIHALDDSTLVLAASDRISTFDVVLPTPIPDKGRVLTGLSAFWFARTRELVPNHLLGLGEDGRTMTCRRLDMFPVEFVVRGYLAGSGWKDYRESGAICGHALPDGMLESSRLPAPIVTPATKAAEGHDENIDEERASQLCGETRYQAARAAALELYRFGSDHAEARGIVLADTKFEFGVGPDGDVVLGDEAMTPDSSRFWPQSEYSPGTSPPSFDKQYVRDYLTQIGWNKEPPAPELPPDVVRKTSEKYREALRRLTE